MALIVEDGSGVANAQAYSAAAWVVAFMTARGKTLEADETTIEGYLLQFMDEAENLYYRGHRIDHQQALSYPRSGVYIRDEIYLADNEIPERIKQAGAWYCWYQEQGFDTAEYPEDRVTKIKVDVIEEEYAKPSQFQSQQGYGLMDLPLVARILEPLLDDGTGGAAVARRIERA